jgi:hypothetical protein
LKLYDIELSFPTCPNPIISLGRLLIVDFRNERVGETRKPGKAAYDMVFM